MRRLLTIAISAITSLVVLGSPAGAQQLVDASKHEDGSGALAFVLFSIMVFGIAFGLFFMDRVRRRPGEE
jgi:hypothetical protein